MTDPTIGLDKVSRAKGTKRILQVIKGPESFAEANEKVYASSADGNIYEVSGGNE